MKKRLILLLAIFTMTLSNAQDKTVSKNASFEDKYIHKVHIIDITQDIIFRFLKELKENNFIKNEDAKTLVKEALVLLEEGEDYQKEYLQFAKDKNWKLAFEFAEKVLGSTNKGSRFVG